jgi:stearoyl-CoA desaturase (delta-9 desaturase)
VDPQTYPRPPKLPSDPKIAENQKMDSASAERAERAPVNWVTAIVFTATPLATLILVPWYGFAHDYSLAAWISFVLILAATGMAITSGYHRLWAHRTYQAHWSVRLIYLFFGTMALQNSVLMWASQHRAHHRFVDDVNRDPYSAKRGFWFSHIGWILRKYPSGEPDFTNAKDLQHDPMVMFQHRYYVPLAVGLNFALPLAIGFAVGDPLGVFLLAGLLRLVVNHHFTFFINSLAHMWGSQPYTDENSARDNGALALITYGEGYHNFHHIFQNDYRNGVRWWQYDPGKWLIAALSGLGLASDLKRVPDMWVHRAQLAMQFKRIERALERKRAHDEHFECIKARVTEEAAAFRKTLEEWARVRDEWVGDRKRRLLRRGEEAIFRSRLREIEHGLRMQRRRLRIMMKSVRVTAATTRAASADARSPSSAIDVQRRSAPIQT